jgi:hypothetical protein
LYIPLSYYKEVRKEVRVKARIARLKVKGIIVKSYILNRLLKGKEERY